MTSEPPRHPHEIAVGRPPGGPPDPAIQASPCVTTPVQHTAAIDRIIDGPPDPGRIDRVPIPRSFTVPVVTRGRRHPRRVEPAELLARARRRD
jgi:hypothetical protein